MSWKRDLMGIDEWSLDLSAQLPRRLRQLMSLNTVAGFTRVAILPHRLQPGVLAAAEIAARARFVGLLVERESDLARYGRPATIGGPGLAALLGDSQDIGDTFTNNVSVTYPFWNGPTNNSFIKAVLDRSNGISAGDLPTPSATPTAAVEIPLGEIPRGLLTTVCRGAFSTWREWRVNPNATLDAKPKADLFRSGEVIVTPEPGGHDGSLYGLRAEDLGYAADLHDVNDRVQAGDPDDTNTGTASTSLPYVTPTGGTLVRRRQVDASKAGSAGAATNIATTQLDKFDEQQNDLTVVVDAADPGRRVDAGDSIYIEDHRQDLYDEANAIEYRGTLRHPTLQRARSVGGKFRPWMSAYLLLWDGSSAFEAHDLTPYVIAESGPCEITIGDFRRSLGYQPAGPTI